MRMMSLPVLLLLLTIAAGQQCPLTMWVFQDYDSCINNPSSPLSEATIYADDTCRTVDTSSNADLFPGTYIAVCLSDGSVQFTMSGCTTADCSSTSGDSICDQSFTSISPFYSYIDEETNQQYTFGVQDPADQESDFFCTRLSGYSGGDTFTVGFAIFGDCTSSECQGGGPAPSPVGTPPPSSSPTITTDPPSVAPDPPSVAPVTEQPTLNPTETEVTDAPTESPSSPPPTVAPFPGSTSSPTTAPVETTNTPSESPETTFEPTESPVTTLEPSVTTSKPSSSSLITDRVRSLSIVLTEMSGRLEDGAERLDWQNVTAAHIESFYQDDNVENLSVIITIASQQTTPSSSGRRRRLASSYSLRIDFVADLAYGGEMVDGVQLIASSFDSDQDRTAYIDQLQADNDDTYKNLDKVELLDDGMPLTVSAASEDNLGIIIGAAVGGGVVVLGLAILLFVKKRKAEKKGKATTPMSVNEMSANEMSPKLSNLSTTVPPASLGTPDAHLTTITLGTPDEVSTLGDPVLAGMQFVDSGGVDEHTASVNDVDYDYVKAQRGLWESPQGSKKSLGSKSYFPSSLGQIESDVLSDDNSFEALFQDEDPRMEERFTVIAPPGKLGMVLDALPGEGPLVHAINGTSVLKDRIRVGDRLISVDAEDVRKMSAVIVSALITQKSQQERTFEFVRRKKR